MPKSPRAPIWPNGCRSSPTRRAALVGQLAREDEIAIAGPLLRRSPVHRRAALIEIARIKGQGHLLAMSERPTLSPDLTE